MIYLNWATTSLTNNYLLRSGQFDKLGTYYNTETRTAFAGSVLGRAMPLNRSTEKQST